MIDMMSKQFDSKIIICICSFAPLYLFPAKMAAVGSGSRDLIGWLSKYRKGILWDTLDRRHFSLNESPTFCADSSAGEGANDRPVTTTGGDDL